MKIFNSYFSKHSNVDTSERQHIGTSKGFTLIEIILTMLIITIVFGVAAEVLLQQADAYSYVNNRKSALQDVRYGMYEMKVELEKMQSTGLNSITSTAIAFIDDKGVGTDFHLGSHGSDMAVYHGTEILIDCVAGFGIDYYDANGLVLVPSSTTKAQVRRIKFNVSTEEQGSEGQINMSMQVTPRDFLGYKNFQ